MKFPQIKIYAHVAYYAIVCVCTIGPAYLYVKYFGPTEEQKIKNLLDKYPDDIKKTREQRGELQAFFDKMKNGENDEVFDKVLKGGRLDEKRRHTYVHPTLNTSLNDKNKDKTEGS